MNARPLPHDGAAEAAVLSAMLLEQKAVDECVARLRPEQFYSEANRWICEAVYALLGEGRPIDLVTVKGWLLDHGRLAQVGGAPYLAKIVDEVPFVTNVGAYAQIVADKAAIRRLIATCQTIAAEAHTEVASSGDFLDRSVEAVDKVVREARGARPEQDLFSEREMFAEVARQMIDGVPPKACTTGIPDLDHDLGGHLRGCVTWMGAGTSWGKSSLAVMTADEVVREGGKVLLISCEDKRDLFARRLIARRARVSSHGLRQHTLDNAAFQEVIEVAKRATDSKFFVEAMGVPAEAIAARIRHICKTQPIDLVIVDYLQAIRLAGKAQDMRVEMSEVARLLTDAIKIANVSGLIFSQIKRLAIGQVPTKNDMKESGDIENMAENVLIGYKRKDGMPILRLAKGKDAPLNDYLMDWDAKSCCFRGGHRVENEAA